MVQLNMEAIHPISLMRLYAKQLQHFAGMARLYRLGSLMIMGACLEGIGLALLTPMLERLNQASVSWRLSWLTAWGIPTTLPTLLLIFVCLVGLRAIVIRQRDLTLLRLRLEFIDHLRLQLQSALAQANWHFLSKLGHAEVTQVLASDLGRVNQGTQFLMQGVGSLTMGLAGIVVALEISPALTLAALCVAVGAGLLMRQRLGAALSMGSELSTANRRFFASLSDFLAGLKIIKSSATEAQHVARFKQDSQALQDKQLAFAASQANTRAVFEVSMALTLAGLLWGAFTVLRLSVPHLLIIVAVFSRLLPMVRDWSQQFQQLMHMLPAFHSYQGWMRKTLQAAEITTNTSTTSWSLHKQLNFEAVSYAHEANGRGLHGVSLSIPALKTTALVGPSGAGKTTLADLALGLLRPDQGQIMVDETPLTDLNRSSWRQAIAYVPQDAFMFPDTIRGNLLLFQPQAQDDALWRALEQSAALDFVKALPLGLDTPVGERGCSLSGGERQRLALARALLGQPQLLILDEATSHLDTENEQRIQMAMMALHGQMTILVIAHRLSTVRHADQVVVLESGRLVQAGTWQDLASQPGAFQRLLEASTH